jgi:predicted ester cyclase
MSAQKNIQLAKLWFEELWSKGDLAIADQIVDPNYAPDWIEIDMKGSEQVKHEIRYFRSVFPDLVYQIIDLAAQDDKVWVRYQGTGTQNGAAWGFEATGKKVSFEGATILYTNQKGKIIDRWGAFCFYDIFSELDLAPPIWELSKHLKKR